MRISDLVVGQPHPAISSLIPVYNRAKLVGPCVQSALEQTLSPLEVIIVDNASTDDTWQVCQSLARQDARVRIWRNETNLGPVHNWQRCIELAQGEYGHLLFSDDLLYPTFLEKTWPYLVDPEVGLVFTAVDMGLAPSDAHPAYTWLNHPAISPSSAFIQDALRGADVPLSPGCAIFRMADLRKNLTLSIPSPSLRDFGEHGAGPDLLLYLLTLNQYPRVAHIAEPQAFFRAHPDSISTQHRGWFIYRRYQQARIWFAATFRSDRLMIHRLLAEMWLSQCKHERRWIPPAECVRQYLPSCTWSWFAVFEIFMERLERRLRDFRRARQTQQESIIK